MRKLVLGAAMSLLITSGLAAADRWTRYENARFAYALEVPPGFSQIAEAENGDGGVSSSADGTAELKVWGGYILEGGFASEVKSRMESDRSDGWDLSYVSQRFGAASWSGTRDDRIVYVRAIAGCDGAASYLRLEYDSRNLKSYGPVITRLVRSFQGGC